MNPRRPMMNRAFPGWAAFMSMALIACAIGLGSMPKAVADDAVVTKTISAPFDKVVAGLTREISAHNLVLVNKIPYQQMVKMVGVNASPMMGFEIFHPRYGKVLYEKDPSALMDAPLRILAREEGGKVTLTYRKPSAVFASYSGLSDMSKQLDQAFADIVAKAGK